MKNLIEKIRIKQNESFLICSLYAAGGFYVPAVLETVLLVSFFSSALNAPEDSMGIGFILAVLFIVESIIWYFISRLMWRVNRFLSVGVFLFALMKLVTVIMTILRLFVPLPFYLQL